LPHQDPLRFYIELEVGIVYYHEGYAFRIPSVCS